jgi:hypothetical protein
MEKKYCLAGSFMTKNGNEIKIYRDINIMNANEVKKDLYKSKNMAKFSHYVSGNLYYTVELAIGTYQFPIATVQFNEDGSTFNIGSLELSEDLGTTEFAAEIKGSDLNRWIAKAIDKGEFIKIG